MNFSIKPSIGRGFTIVELLIVIVVIGILAAVTVVAYNGITQRAKASAINAEMTQLTKQLKLLAVEQGSCNFLATYVNSNTGYYARDFSLNPTVLTRCEPNIMLDTWDSPAPGIVNDDLFATYWRSVITAPAAGSYTFYGSVDDQQRLFLNNNLVLETSNGNDYTYTTSFAANEKILLRYEFREGAGGARALLEWTGPGISRTPVIPLTI